MNTKYYLDLISSGDHKVYNREFIKVASVLADYGAREVIDSIQLDAGEIEDIIEQILDYISEHNVDTLLNSLVAMVNNISALIDSITSISEKCIKYEDHMLINNSVDLAELVYNAALNDSE